MLETDEQSLTPAAEPVTAPRPALNDSARRALAEAEERRASLKAAEGAVEINGRGGLDPARYGDWEIKGLAIDF
jgi:hypothetical protein